MTPAASSVAILDRRLAPLRVGLITVTAVPADPSWPPVDRGVAAQVHALVNAHRVSKGMHALQPLGSLTASAEWKARHMAQYTYMEHDDPLPPVARTWYERITDNGYTGFGAGENIAGGWQTPEKVMAAWVGSPAHLANIQGNWTTTGIGAALQPHGVWWWAQEFGGGQGDTPPPPPPSGNRALVDEAVAELKGTTMTYAHWLAKPYSPTARARTSWGKALAALEQITN